MKVIRHASWSLLKIKWEKVLNFSSQDLTPCQALLSLILYINNISLLWLTAVMRKRLDPFSPSSRRFSISCLLSKTCEGICQPSSGCCCYFNHLIFTERWGSKALAKAQKEAGAASLAMSEAGSMELAGYVAKNSSANKDPSGPVQSGLPGNLWGLWLNQDIWPLINFTFTFSKPSCLRH